MNHSKAQLQILHNHIFPADSHTLIQAADYLEDDPTVSSASTALADMLFSVPANHPISSEIFDCLSENIALAVLRASRLPLSHLLTRVPAAHHALALLASNPSIDHGSSVSLPIMDSCPTRFAIRALAHFPHLSALRFRPWMPLGHLLNTLQDLRALSNIVSLDMSQMHVSIPAAGVLASALWQMPHLRALDLCETSLGATGAAVLLPVVANICALRTLLLRDCGLRTAGTERQCMSLSPKLRMLDLSCNLLGDRGVQAVARIFSESSCRPPGTEFLPTGSSFQLEWFDICDNSCSSCGLLQAAKALLLLPCVQQAMLVSRSDISSLSEGTMAMMLQVLGPQVSCIRNLSLGGLGERVSAMHAATLSPLLHTSPSTGYSCMPGLRDLDLSYTELSMEWCNAFAHALQHARALRTLKLTFCGLEDSPMEAVLLAVCGAPLLDTLDLRGNVIQLLSRAAAALVATLPTLSCLANLSLCIAPGWHVHKGLHSQFAAGPHITQFRQLLAGTQQVHRPGATVACAVALVSDAIGAALCAAISATPCHPVPVSSPDIDMWDDACSSHHCNVHEIRSQTHVSAAPLGRLYLDMTGSEYGACNPAVERSLAAMCPHLAQLPNLQDLHLEHALISSSLLSVTRSTRRGLSNGPWTPSAGHSPSISHHLNRTAMLTALTSLNLSVIDDDSSALGMDRGLKDLAALIAANASLQRLVLGISSRGSGRVIGEGAGRFAFSRALNSLFRLSHLDLCEEMCDEEFLRATFTGACFLSCLQELRLSLDSQCKVARVAEALAHGRALHLRTLHLHGVHVSRTCVAALCQYAAQGPALEELWLDSDWITEEVASHLAPAIGSMQCLQVLSFARNPMRDRGVAEIARQLERLQSLRTLSFCCCHMSSAGVVALAEHVTCLSRLQVLRLSGEFVGPVAMSEALAPALAMLGALSVLQLHDNHIGDEGATALAQWLQGHAALCQVALTSNDVMDSGALALARCFRRLPALQRVHVTGNRFGEQGHAAMAALQGSLGEPIEVHW